MSEKLMQQNIQKAEQEIEKKRNLVKNSSMRQRYHFMPPAGWMNDPNGLIYFKEKYHLFFQHNPYSTFWDCMYWGHAVSEDMVHWEYLPEALAPSEFYDNYQKGGCFSGSAIEHDGKLFLIYTATANHGKGNEQTQCIAWSEDGIHFVKYEGNPVITAPEGILLSEFRDPKIWKHDGKFYVVCGASCKGRAQALLFCSEDIFHWSFLSVLAESRGEGGRMWECPDFFQIGEQYVLTYSPMGVGDHTSVYQMGDFDYKTGKFVGKIMEEMDWGFDYYAPQSFLTPDGRRVVVTWANEWEWMPHFKDWGPTFEDGWCGFFNLPREVRRTDNGKLQFIPVKELETLRTDMRQIDCLRIGERKTELMAGDGVSFELKLKINLEDSDAEQIELELRSGEGKKTLCCFDLKKGELRVNRNCSDGWSNGVSKSILFLKEKKELDVHIFSDQSSLEIFTDQYRNNHSMNIFAGNNQNKIYMYTHGGEAAVSEIETYGLLRCM